VSSGITGKEREGRSLGAWAAGPPCLRAPRRSSWHKHLGPMYSLEAGWREVMGRGGRGSRSSELAKRGRLIALPEEDGSPGVPRLPVRTHGASDCRRWSGSSRSSTGRFEDAVTRFRVPWFVTPEPLLQGERRRPALAAEGRPPGRSAAAPRAARRGTPQRLRRVTLEGPLGLPARRSEAGSRPSASTAVAPSTAVHRTDAGARGGLSRATAPGRFDLRDGRGSCYLAVHAGRRLHRGLPSREP